MKTVDIAQRIRQAREAARMSQEQLGQAIGVTDKSISAYEKKRAEPSIEKLKKIALSTNQSLNFFTDEQADQATITGKLNSIEKELQEIRRLLQKTSN